jgi:hypothetical protein
MRYQVKFNMTRDANLNRNSGFIFEAKLGSAGVAAVPPPVQQLQRYTPGPATVGAVSNHPSLVVLYELPG